MSHNNNESLVLALETSGRAGSVAIGNSQKVLSEVFFSGMMRHNAELLKTVGLILADISRKPSDITEIYLTIGPGSFTGVRIAVAMAKMMALATGAKIVPVSTMDAISSNADAFIEDTNQQVNRIATIIDAKRNHFFVAFYEKQGKVWKKTMNDCLMKSADFVDKFAGSEEPVWLLGEGLVYYKDKFAADGIEFMDEKYWPARAAGVYKTGLLAAKAGNYADPKKLTPVYLRRSDAEENLEKRKASQ